MDFFAKTDKGKKRRMNQDYVFATDCSVGALPNLFLLADGMGGHKAGDFASHYLVEKLRQNLSRRENAPVVKLIAEEIIRVNGELLRLSEENENLQGMGSTLVCAVIEGDIMTVANVGDSRAYIIRNKRIQQITKDHSYVEEMVEKGLMRRGSSEYQNSKNMITRVVGFESVVQPDFFEVDLKEGDYVLLCSDGLTNMVDNESIRSIIMDSSSVKRKVESLIDMANINGGRDNIGIVLIDPYGKEAV